MARIRNTERYEYDRVVTKKDYVIGTDAEHLGLPTKNYLIGDIVELAVGEMKQDFGNKVLNGGYIWIQGYEYYVWADEYVVNGVYYTTYVSGFVTLDNPDASFDRIDLLTIVVAEVGSLPPFVSKITGLPAPNPLRPASSPFELEVAFVIVQQGTTENSDIVATAVYNENLQEVGGEFDTFTATPAQIDFANSVQVFSGLVSTRFNIAQQVNAQFTHTVPITGSSLSNIHFQIYLGTDTILFPLVVHELEVELWDTGANERVGIAYVIDRAFNFDADQIGSWQNVIIDSASFRPPDGDWSTTTFNQIIIKNRGNDSLYWIDSIEIQEGLPLIDPSTGHVTRTSQLINDGEGDLPFITKSAITGLEAIDEGNGIGHRLIGRDPTLFGNIGRDAIDFSVSYSATPNRGSTGTVALTFGENNDNPAYSGLVGGFGNTQTPSSTYGVITGTGNQNDGYNNQLLGENHFIEGDYNFTANFGNTITGGNYNTVLGVLNVFTNTEQSYGIGSNLVVSGDFDTILGSNLFGRSVIETVVGRYNTDYIPFNDSIFVPVDPRDRAFTVGIGISSQRADGLIILGTGEVTLPEMTNALIDAEPTGKVALTREWVEANYSITDTFDLQLVTDNGNTTTQDLETGKIISTVTIGDINLDASLLVSRAWVDAQNYYKSILNSYVDLAALLFDQAAQNVGELFYVVDGSGFAAIDSGYIYVEYLGTVLGNEIDYRTVFKEQDFDRQDLQSVTNFGNITTDSLLIKSNTSLFEAENLALTSRSKVLSTGVLSGFNDGISLALDPTGAVPVLNFHSDTGAVDVQLRSPVLNDQILDLPDKSGVLAIYEENNLYNGVEDLEATILALSPLTFIGQTWWARDTKSALKAITSGITSITAWQDVTPKYDEATDTYQLPTTQDGQTLNEGQEMFFLARNDEAIQIVLAAEPKIFLSLGAIAGDENFDEAIKANAADIPDGAQYGVNTTDANPTDKFKCTTYGRVNSVNTSAWIKGDILYVHPVAKGEMTNVRPLKARPVAVVEKVGVADGILDINTISNTQLDKTTSLATSTVVNLTGQEVSPIAGTFYEALLEDEGIVASVNETAVCGNNTTTPLAQDHLSEPFVTDVTIIQGERTAQLSYEVSGTNANEQFFMEIYLTDGDGTIINSGIGLPNGTLGFEPINFMQSEVLNTPVADVEGIAQLDGNLIGDFTFLAGQRYLVHILCRKEGSGGMDYTFTVYFGSDHESRLIGILQITTDVVINVSNVTGDNATEAFNDLDVRVKAKMQWESIWQAGAYIKEQVVTDGLWTMIANKDTSDRPAPQSSGNFTWASDLAGVPAFLTPTNANTYYSGNRFTFTAFMRVNGYRWYVPEATGNFIYEIWLTTNGGSVNKIFGAVSPSSIGWITIPAVQDVLAGTVVDLIVVARALTQPNFFAADWDVKNTNGNPSAGESNFQNSATELRVNHEDKDSIDRQASLESITVGGTVTFGGLEWTITAINLQGDHVRFFISPNQGRPTENTQTVAFSWGSSDPVSYVEDVGYYGAFPEVQGFSDTTYPPAGLNTNLYGVDINADIYDVSPDWDIVAVSGSGGGGGGGDLSGYVTLTTDQTITGIKTFGATPLSNPIPTLDDHLVNKLYVDSQISGTEQNDFLTAQAFNTGTGDLTSTIPNQADPIVNLDGRYPLIADAVQDLQSVTDNGSVTTNGISVASVISSGDVTVTGQINLSGNGVIENTTGRIDFRVGLGLAMRLHTDGIVELKYNGNTRLTTTSTGMTFIGAVSASTAPTVDDHLGNKLYIDTEISDAISGLPTLTNIAYTDVANIFTENQRISKADPFLELNGVGGSSLGLHLTSNKTFQIKDYLGASLYTIDTSKNHNFQSGNITTLGTLSASKISNTTDFTRPLTIKGDTFGSTARFQYDSGQALVEILGNVASRQAIQFGTSANNNLGSISFDNPTSELHFRTSDVNRLIIDSLGITTVFKTTTADLDITNLQYNNESVSVLVQDEVLGVDSVTNGDFNSSVDWTESNGAIISGGLGNIVGDGSAFGSLAQNVGFISGKIYIISLDAVITSGLGLKVQDGLTNENIGAITVTGSYTFVFTAGTSGVLTIGRRTGGTPYDSSIDNVSVREVISSTDSIQKRVLGDLAFKNDADLHEFVAYTNVQNEFTSNQIITNESPRLTLRETGGLGGDWIIIADSDSLSFRYPNSGVSFHTINSSGNHNFFAGNLLTTGITTLGTLLKIGDATAGNIEMLRPSANYITATDAAGQIGFRTGGYNLRYRIDAAGNHDFFSGSITTLATATIGDTSFLPLSLNRTSSDNISIGYKNAVGTQMYLGMGNDLKIRWGSDSVVTNNPALLTDVDVDLANVAYTNVDNNFSSTQTFNNGSYNVVKLVRTGTTNVGIQFVLDTGTNFLAADGDNNLHWGSNISSTLNPILLTDADVDLANVAYTNVNNNFSTSQNFTHIFSDQYVAADEYRSFTNNQLIINAGESFQHATGQTGEQVYINGESGLEVNSSPDNWVSGWAGRNTATVINNPSGHSGFGTASPQTKLHIEGLKNTAIIRLGSTTNDTSWIDGDIYGGIEVHSADGSNGGVGSVGYMNWVNENTTTGNRSSIVFGTRDLSVGVVEAMRIHYSGNIGLGGITNPSELLHMNGNIKLAGSNRSILSDSGYTQIGVLGGGVVHIGGDSGTSYIEGASNHLSLQTSRDSDDILFKTGDSLITRMSIDGTTGLALFGSNVSSNPAPTIGDHLTNKTYVDAQVGGSILDWLRADVADTKTGDLTMLGNAQIINESSASVNGSFSYHSGTSEILNVAVGDYIIQGNGTPRFTFGRTTGDLALTSINGLTQSQFLRSDVADTKTFGDLTFASGVKADFNGVMKLEGGAVANIKLFGADLLIRDDSTTRFTFGRTTGDLTLTSINGLTQSQFLRSDTADTKTAGGLTFNDNISIKLGTTSKAELSYSTANSTPQLNLISQDFQIRYNNALKFTFGGSSGDLTATGKGTFGGDIITDRTGDAVSGIVKVLTDNTQVGIIQFSDPQGDSGSISYVHSTDTLYLGTNGTFNQLTIDSSGNLTVTGTVTAAIVETEIIQSDNTGFSTKAPIFFYQIDDTGLDVPLVINDAGNLIIEGTAQSFVAPTIGNHFTNKTYVDGLVSNGYVPYTGATADVDLGTHWLGLNQLYAQQIQIRAGFDTLFMTSTIGAGILQLNNDLSAEFFGDVGIGTASPLWKLEVAEITGDTLASTTTIAITTGGKYGLDGTRKYLNLDFVGFNNDTRARIQSYDKSGTAQNGTLSFWTDSSFGNLVEAMTITKDQNVGIGTASPWGKLEVFDATNNSLVTPRDYDGGLTITNTSTIANAYALLKFANYGGDESSDGTYIKSIGTANNVSDLLFGEYDNGATNREHLIIKGTTGNVGIGTTAPDFILDVRNSMQIRGNDQANARLYLNNTAGTTWAVQSGIYNISQTGFSITDGSTQRLVIDGGGNVGIGTTSPTELLEVANKLKTSGSDATWEGINGIEFNDTRNQAGARRWFVSSGATSQGSLVFRVGTSQLGDPYASGSTKMIILSDGNVGIGTTTPQTQLHVTGGTGEVLRLDDSSATGNPFMTFYQNGTRRAFIQYINAGDFAFVNEYGGVRFMVGTGGVENTAFDITSAGKSNFYSSVEIFNGDLVIGTGNSTAVDHIDTSDIRLKENIRDYKPKKIDVRWREYELKSDGSTHLGVIADELLETNPEFVVIPERQEDMKSVRYTRLLIAKNAELEARIEKLEALIQKLL